MASRFLKYLQTPKGRSFVAGTAFIVATATGVVSYVPHTLLLDYYRDFVAMRKNGNILPVPDNLNGLFKQVLEDLSLHDYYKSLSKPFMVFGFDVYHMGSLTSRMGAYIGMPINFTYANVSSIPKDTTFINNEPVNWQRDDAKQLLESLIISEDAKKYALAREILVTNNNHITFATLNSSMMVAFVYGFTSKVNDHLQLRQKPRALRYTMYALTCAFAWGVWAMTKDGMARHYEADADEHIAQLGEHYIRGAIEYYEKTLQRNKALRTLLGSQGQNAFNSDGDEIFFIRQKHLPATRRKEFFEKKLVEKSMGKEQVGEAITAIN